MKNITFGSVLIVIIIGALIWHDSDIGNDLNNAKETISEYEEQIEELKYKISDLEEEVLYQYDNGYESGHEEGYDVGYDDGFYEGRKLGYEEGFSDGEADYED